MSDRVKKTIGVIAPIVLSVIGILLWRQYGFEPLDRWELPLAAWLNGLTGHNDAFDWLVIFFNNFWGEAITVVIAFAAYCLLARWITGPKIDWRPVAVYAAYIFVVWAVGSGLGTQYLENYFNRASPSHMIGDDLVKVDEIHGVDVKTASDTSFPSDHGNVFFTLFFMCLLRWGWKTWVLFPICLLLASPRCFTGAHWVTDTLIGSALFTWIISAIAVYTPLYWITQKLETMSLRFPRNAPVGEPPP